MSQVPSVESLLIHAGTARDLGRPGTPPLVPTSFYVSCGEPQPGREYGRESNPGWEALEAALGGIEQADAAVLASGQAASMALLLALAKDRKRVVLCRDGYYGTRALAGKLGVESTWERRARWTSETAPAGLIRLSVGVEPAADLITAIDHALEVL